MKGHLLIAHGGGPTPVINSSLYGAVSEAFGHEEIDKIYGALGGTAGILAERFLDFDSLPQKKLELLKSTPGTAIGTSRTHLEPEDYEAMVRVCQKNGIQYVLFNGGNGTMDTCAKFCKAAEGTEIRVVGIPKTVDNDINETDHCPGYGSAARYIAQTAADIAQDVRSMPIHVVILEAMGRDCGWIAAASALARKRGEDGPHLILLPEIPFNEEKFISRVDELHRAYGGVLVVASEGLRNSKGDPVAGETFRSGRSITYGDVSNYLAELIKERLNIKTRGEQPGIAGRASITCQSQVDREEAILAGAEACRAAVEGETDVMIGFERLSDNPYEIRTTRVPIEKVTLTERRMPEKFISSDGFGVTPAFCDWCGPLIGGALPDYVFFNR